jgi:hypothetical protein
MLPQMLQHLIMAIIINHQSDRLKITTHNNGDRLEEIDC